MRKIDLSARAAALVRNVLKHLAPPPVLRLSDWAEENIILPAGQSARPGRYRNWPYFRDILDSIGDPEVETVSLQKAVRVGLTKGLIIGIGAKVATDPCPIGLLVPTDDDARGYAVDEIEPLFEATPALALLQKGRGIMDRNTLTRKSFMGGGSLKILSARSPRNLRRHGFKMLYGDEIDAMEVTTEGDPLSLAEKRTMAYPDRKIVWGSTPTEEDVSNIERKYRESDQRVFEIPCPHCEEVFELMWEHIQWPEGEPEKATAYCPHCGAEIDEHDKRAIVERGRWRATCPEVQGHHGYRLNALVSLLANAAWGKLAQEFIRAKRGGPAEMQVFKNTILGQTWRVTLNRLSGEDLAARVEPFGLDDIPKQVLMLTCGVDVQDDRLELTVLGWGLYGSPWVLAHFVIDGSTLDDETWDELDKFLKRRWMHPHAWEMKIDACAIDSGGSQGRTQKVYDFSAKRARRCIYAVKGVAGARAIWTKAQRVKGNARLFLVGHDQTKTAVMEALSRDPYDAEGQPDPHAVHVSDELPAEWFEGVTSETRRIRYVRNRPVIEFLPKRAGIRNEPLDCMCYGWAARFSPGAKIVNLRERAAREPPPPGETPPPKKSKFTEWSRQFNQPG